MVSRLIVLVVLMRVVWGTEDIKEEGEGRQLGALVPSSWLQALGPVGEMVIQSLNSRQGR
jgi:hypothetical protein